MSQNVQFHRRCCRRKIGHLEATWNAPVDWVLVFFVLFKGLVFVAGMYFAVKWHYDQEKKPASVQRLVLAGARYTALFLLALLLVLAFTLGLARMLGMDLSLP